MIYDIAVIIPTLLRPSLARAVRSVFSQDFPGTVQIMIGIDVAQGPREILEELRAECPQRMELSVVDLGYSTAAVHGGLYRLKTGGALRTILSYAANSVLLAYLDDDNWWAPGHLSDLRKVIKGRDWAYSLRWYVDPATLKPLCIDEWESRGPGKGIYKDQHGGFVDTNCLMLNKVNCHWVLPAWSVPAHFEKARGVDRMVFIKLRDEFKTAGTGKPTAYYVFPEESRPSIRARLKVRTDFTEPPEVGNFGTTPSPGSGGAKGNG